MEFWYHVSLKVINSCIMVKSWKDHPNSIRISTPLNKERKYCDQYLIKCAWWSLIISNVSQYYQIYCPALKFFVIFWPPIALPPSSLWSVVLSHQPITKPILLCKYLGYLKLYWIGSVFTICAWISVFRRKKSL